MSNETPYEILRDWILQKCRLLMANAGWKVRFVRPPTEAEAEAEGMLAQAAHDGRDYLRREVPELHKTLLQRGTLNRWLLDQQALTQMFYTKLILEGAPESQARGLAFAMFMFPDPAEARRVGPRISNRPLEDFPIPNAPPFNKPYYVLEES